MTLATVRRPRLPSRIAYVVSEYPATSHSFIRREVAALRARGVEIDTYSIHKATNLVAEADREAAITTSAIRPISIRALIACHLQAFRRSPKAYWTTLSFAASRGERGARAVLWQFFYFSEAIVLWSRCRARGTTHIHAHFGNSGCDVARLAATFGRRAGDHWSWSFTMHGSAEFLDLKRFRLGSKVTDADFVVCISDYCRSQLMWLVEPDQWPKLRVIHCGVVADSRPEILDRGALTTLRVLTVGRLIRLKAHALLLEAAEILLKRGIVLEIKIIGGGPYEKELRKFSAARGLQGHLELLGPVGKRSFPVTTNGAMCFVCRA